MFGATQPVPGGRGTSTPPTRERTPPPADAPYLRAAHQLWQRRTPATEAQAERARILAEAMLRAGDPNDTVERQLLGLGIPPRHRDRRRQRAHHQTTRRRLTRPDTASPTTRVGGPIQECRRRPGAHGTPGTGPTAQVSRRILHDHDATVGDREPLGVGDRIEADVITGWHDDVLVDHAAVQLRAMADRDAREQDRLGDDRARIDEHVGAEDRSVDDATRHDRARAQRAAPRPSSSPPP